MKAKLIQPGLIYTPEDNAPLTRERKTVLDRIRPGARVLEIGAHGGHFSKLLSDRGCELSVVEVDSEAAVRAKQVVSDVIVGDIEDPRVLSRLNGRKYDFVLFMHVLEHLVDPWRVLKRCRALVNTGGAVMALLPNVGSWRIRKELFFKGTFEYADVGILDRTHLRFFTLHSGRELFEQSGYRVITLQVLDASVPLEVRLRACFGARIGKFWHDWMIGRYPNLCADIIYFEAHPQ